MVDTPDRPDRDAVARAFAERYRYTTLLLEDRDAEVMERLGGEPRASERLDAVGEARRWLDRLRSGVARELDVPPYIEDMAAYEAALRALAEDEAVEVEAAWVAARNARLPPPGPKAIATLVPVVGKHVRIEHYAFDVPAIVRAIENCDRLEPATRPRACAVALLKMAGQLEPCTLVINSSTEALLAACDGNTDCAGVARAFLGDVTDPRDRASVESSMLRALEALRAMGVLTYRDPGGTQEDGLPPAPRRTGEGSAP